MGFGVKAAWKYFNKYKPTIEEKIEYDHYTMYIIPKKKEEVTPPVAQPTESPPAVSS